MIITAQLLDAHASYLETVSPFYDDVLHTVTATTARDGCLGKVEIGALVFWKRIQANTTWARFLHETPEYAVRTKTATAVAAARDRTVDAPAAAAAARSALIGLPGFDHGDALASAVLLAAAPDRMAVYDDRAQRGIARLGLTLSSAPGRYARYMQLIEDLLAEVHANEDVRWIARDVDVALYTIGGRKNHEEAGGTSL
jgi:hypothetical protein